MSEMSIAADPIVPIPSFEELSPLSRPARVAAGSVWA
jgi:hypothetical protein